jgi:hypothetical protein
MIPFLILLAIALFATYFFTTMYPKKGVVATVTPIDPAWLEDHVLFYSELDAELRKIFEQKLSAFLTKVRITGVDTTVSETDRVLIAAAAIIPIFYFDHWEYPNLREVLVYSDSINMDFETKGNADRNILGMVGTGPLEGSLLLSKHALQQGFLNQTDKNNTAIHEFVHLIDKLDGETDGIPELLLNKPYVLPWVNLMHEKMQQIAAGKSDINPYATMNKAEFFAVASEYFFERPDLLAEKHPVLYSMLKEMFDVPGKMTQEQ